MPAPPLPPMPPSAQENLKQIGSRAAYYFAIFLLILVALVLGSALLGGSSKIRGAAEFLGLDANLEDY